MKTMNLNVTDLVTTIVPIGFVGENLRTQVIIDCKSIFDEYPDAVVSMTVKPPKGDMYPAIVTRDGNLVSWEISDSDLLHEGGGEIQLAFVVGETVAKSYIGRVRIQKSLIPTGDAPSTIVDWIIHANNVLGELEEVVPSGGTTGQVLKKKSDTDYDTEWGDDAGGVQIDDTAGVGDTGVTWSANKSATELNGKADKEGTILTTTLSRGRKANTDIGTGSFAFGNDVTASSSYSHAEGNGTVASGGQSHSEGYQSYATGYAAHAEGITSTSDGYGSHSENTGHAKGYWSHAEGYNTRATHKCQHVFGEYNIWDSSQSASSERGTYVEIVGNGETTQGGSTYRSNARALDWDGNERLKGDLYVNCNADSTGGIKVAFPAPPESNGTYKLTCVVSDGNPTYSWVSE